LPYYGLLQSHFRIVQETVACAAVGEADGYILARRVGGSPDTWSCWAFHVRAGPSRKNGTVLDLPPSACGMANLSGIVMQLKKERDRVEQQLSGLNAALAAFAGIYSGTAKSKPIRKRRKMSAKSRAQIAAAQRARWAKVRGRSC